MHYILFDDAVRLRLLPFTHTRPVADIRCGILTMRERWERLLGAGTGTLTEAYMARVFPMNDGLNNCFVNGSVFGSRDLAAKIAALQPGQKLVKDELVIAAYPVAAINAIAELTEAMNSLQAVTYEGDVHSLKNIWNIFQCNDRSIREDFALITAGRKSAPVPDGVQVTGVENLFIEEGAHIYGGCIINASTGSVYIGKDTEVLEGSLMRGPIAICEQGVVKMGAKIYGATTIGPACKVGGEINNVVFFANSNKAHDGYLGNAVIGEWCNLGADTNCSNLKNNYDNVKIWDEALNRSVHTGLTFCGLFMGDHSKCAINTMFNTGTVVGVSCNIFGSGFPDRFVKSFSWGGIDGGTGYDFARAMETAHRMMARRNRKLTADEMDMYRYVFDHHRK